MQRRLAEALADRAAPVVAMSGEVVLGQRRAMLPREGGDLAGERAAIEGFAARLGDQAQALCHIGRAEDLAGERCPAARHEMRGEAGLLLQRVGATPPELADDRGDVEAARGVVDRRLEQGLEGQLAEALRQLGPGRDGARHGDALPATLRHAALSGEALGRPGSRRAARGVEPVQLLAVPEDAEGIGAETVAGRLDHRQGDRGGERRIERITALAQHREAGLGRQRMRGRDEVAGEDGRAPGRVGRVDRELHGEAFSGVCAHGRAAGREAARPTG